jgi:3-dehydroquinate dehydratase-2
VASRVMVLNGPNLARLGTREPEIYGSVTYDDIAAACRSEGEQLGLTVDVRQTDDEAEFIGWLHELADGGADAAILNPAAWTHSSVAIRDAAAQLGVPFVEVHLSNPLRREEFRHTSYTAGLAVGVVAGFGANSYLLALRAVADLLA